MSTLLSEASIITAEASEAVAAASASAGDMQPPAKVTKVEGMDDAKTKPMTKAREIRLEQNRKAARESRKRKKIMIEELQRSVIFFSRANSTLKQQNDNLTRLLLQAQSQVNTSEASANAAEQQQVTLKTEGEAVPPVGTSSNEQAEAQAVATQAVYESQGFPAAAARAAAQTMNASGQATSIATTTTAQPGQPFPTMQTGATMQAMANFQQAAAAAMQSAMGQMQSIPGVNMNQIAAQPVGTNAQQAYTDTMTALAMQQAAAAAASGQQFVMAPGAVPFIHPQMVAWQQAQQQQPTQAPAQSEHDTAETA